MAESLIIESHQQVRQLFERIVRELGHEPVIATAPAMPELENVKLVIAEPRDPPSALLAEEIQRADPLIPTICVSVLAEPKLNLPFDVYLPKPFIAEIWLLLSRTPSTEPTRNNLAWHRWQCGAPADTSGKTPDAQRARTPDPCCMSATAVKPSSPAAARPHPGSPGPAIHTERLSKRYGSTLALDSLDLTVARGEVYGYLGPNGSGKTTTIRLLLGLHRPSAGRAEVFGHDAWRDPVAAHRYVAYVAGEPFLWPALTSAETFEFLARLHGGTDAAYRNTLIERFQLDPHKKIRALSKGNRQKVQLIAALASRAELLLLDEPTSGLDPLMEVVFRDAVKEAKGRGQTVFLSSHILSEVEALCDRVGILREGRLVDEGTLDELRHLAAQTVEVTFAGHAPMLPPLPGVQVQAAGPNALRFEVSGSVGPLIAALAEHPVATLTSREPSLEEIFIHHYDGYASRGGK